MRKLALQIIKIDKTLADDMFTEGAETQEAVAACGELSCDRIQGYYYSKPLPEEAFPAFAREHNQTAS